MGRASKGGQSLGGYIAVCDDELLRVVGHCHLGKVRVEAAVGSRWMGGTKAVRCATMRRWWSIKQKLGGSSSSRGPPPEATEWDQRGIGSSKDGNRDWGRNVVSSGNALALLSIGIEHQQPQRNPRTFTRSQCEQFKHNPINQLNGNEMTPAGEALQGPACRVSAWKR